MALAECCIAGRRGVDCADTAVDGRWDAALFGETQSRIVASLPPDRLSALAAICDAEGVPWTTLGYVSDAGFRIGGLIDTPMSEIADAWQNGLQRALEG